ncbi:signal transducer and activator of transcription, partial [Reticulomyxa filosa]
YYYYYYYYYYLYMHAQKKKKMYICTYISSAEQVGQNSSPQSWSKLTSFTFDSNNKYVSVSSELLQNLNSISPSAKSQTEMVEDTMWRECAKGGLGRRNEDQSYAKFDQVTHALQQYFLDRTENKWLAGQISCQTLEPFLSHARFNLVFDTANAANTVIFPHQFRVIFEWFQGVCRIVTDSNLWNHPEMSFHGFFPKKKVEETLNKCPPGTFIIRFSSSHNNAVDLSYRKKSKNEQVHALMVRQDNGIYFPLNYDYGQRLESIIWELQDLRFVFHPNGVKKKEEFCFRYLFNPKFFFLKKKKKKKKGEGFNAMFCLLFNDFAF